MNSPDPTAALLQAAAVLLRYPDAEQRATLPIVGTALRVLRPGATRDSLLDCCEHLQATPAAEAEQHYVEVLDRKRRCCLYLTWWTEGETRRRGLALARLKARYRDQGFLLRTAELPDFLPVVLEFGAQAGPALGLTLLQEHRAALELLRLALLDVDSPYSQVLTAVCALLPGASPADEQAARALARSGPPAESVGLEPYGIPFPAGRTRLPLVEGGPDPLQDIGARR